MTVILGIDPGSRMTGIGLIKKSSAKFNYLYCDTIKTPEGEMPYKLQAIFDGVSHIMRQYQPDEVAIEAIFMHKNAQSALKLGQARGVAIVAATLHQASIYEYSARQIKQAVVGYGGAEKNQVQHMVRQILNLAVKPQQDAADALAVAVCHSNMNKQLISLAKVAKVRGRRRR